MAQEWGRYDLVDSDEEGEAKEDDDEITKIRRNTKQVVHKDMIAV